MSIVEQAVKRLEELRRAGVDIPDARQLQAAVSSGAIASRGTQTSPKAAEAASGFRADSSRPNVAEPQRARQRPVDPRKTSRAVELDIERLASMGYLTPVQSDRRLADDFRNVKLHVLRNAEAATERGQKHGNIVLVTSALPGEGKTFTSVNLALSIASQVDQSVLLVDADVLRPAAIARLGLEPQAGLTDLLTHPEMPVSDVLLRTNIPKFSLLGAGTVMERAAELLGSVAMSELIEDLAQRYPDRLIVIDGPPVLVSTISRSLASQVGQILMVVEAEASKRTVVLQALAALEGCPNVEVVLNKSRLPPAGSEYGYYGQHL